MTPDFVLAEKWCRILFRARKLGVSFLTVDFKNDHQFSDFEFRKDFYSRLFRHGLLTVDSKIRMLFWRETHIFA
jgi:hypothetical protein